MPTRTTRRAPGIDLQISKEKYFRAIGYTPEPVQRDVHQSPARFRVNIQGRRSGKSYGAAREAEVQILAGGTRGWIVGPTYDLADKIGREIDRVLIRQLRLPVTSGERHAGKLRYAKFWNGSEIWIKSADRPDSLIGEGLDWLIVDEAAIISRLTWEQHLRATLSDRNGWCLFSGTPRGYNWIYDLYCRGKSVDYSEWDSWQHPSWHSRYFRDDVDELRRTLTRETFDQEYGAQFTSFAGKVYPFSRNTHARRLGFQPEWETFCSIDFGYRMPSVGWYQVGKVSGQHEVHLIDEISHRENIKTEQLADMILAKKYPTIRYFGDPAGGGAQSQSGLGDIEVFRRKGIRVHYKTDRISRTISAGVGLVRSWFENAKGQARFFVDEKCVGHIEDFEAYRYPEKKEERTLLDEPMKDGRHDHGCDECRYFFINRFPIKKREAFTVDL